MLKDVHKGRSEIQYGHQAAILDFLSLVISQEQLKHLIQNFKGYCYMSVDVPYRISGRSEIQYGHSESSCVYMFE